LLDRGGDGRVKPSVLFSLIELRVCEETDVVGVVVEVLLDETVADALALELRILVLPVGKKNERLPVNCETLSPPVPDAVNEELAKGGVGAQVCLSEMKLRWEKEDGKAQSVLGNMLELGGIGNGGAGVGGEERSVPALVEV
jgi:hypothetical protein